MSAARLPKLLQPRKGANLVRVGRNRDGGYVLDHRSVMIADLLLSFGIEDEWSFEKEFSKLAGVPVIAFDATTGLKFFLERLVDSALRIHTPRKFLQAITAILDYPLFFRHNNTHIKKFVGMDKQPDFISTQSIMRDYVGADTSNIFVKIDIEGWEYRIIEEIEAIADRICGLVIEFHDVDLHMSRIQEFVERVPLNICHVHCNNYSTTSQDLIPLVVEISFTKFDVQNEYVENLPSALDRPNNPRRTDYSLTFL